MEEKSNKKYIAVMSLSVFCLIVIVVSVSYAYFTPRIVGEGKSVNAIAGKVKLQISESKINASNLLPIKDSSKSTKAQKNEFTISRTDESNLKACYSLYLVIDKIGDNLKNKWFKYELDYVNVDGQKSTLEGNFENIVPEEDGTLKIAFLTNQEVNDVTTSRTYTLRLWLSYSDTEDQTFILLGDAESKTFNARILAEGVSGECKIEQSR